MKTDTHTIDVAGLTLEEPVAHLPVAAPQHALAVTPMDLLARAYQSGASPETLTQLLQLKREYEADEARKAFVVAMAQFKQNPPEIIKDKAVGYEDSKGNWVGYKHATLASVCAAAIQGLAQVGISHSWSVDQSSGQIAVTCVLTHSLGHSERVTMAAGADTSGKKNSIQAIASTTTYLQRYTLLSITGLATKDQDDDGTQHQERLPDWMAAYAEAISASENLEQLVAAWKTAAAACRRKQDKPSYDELKLKVGDRCAALGITADAWAAACPKPGATS